MGAGKTSVSRELKKLLPHAVFLDGDNCWDADPFVVTDETKEMVIDNITHLLGNFLSCTAYTNVIFCWVMNSESIVDAILSRLNLDCVNFRHFTLMLTKEALSERLDGDIARGIRLPDIKERSAARLGDYDCVNSAKIDVSTISPREAAEKIEKML